MVDSGFEYVKSSKGLIRIAIIASGFLAFILVVSARFCEGALVWVAVTFMLSISLSLASFIVTTASLTSRIQLGIAYEDVDIYLSTFSFFGCLLASIVLAINARTTLLWIIADVLGFGMVGMYAFEIYIVRENIPENLNYLKTVQGGLKTAILVVGCTTFSLLDASVFHCYYPDGCNAARTWVFAAFFYCWFGSSLLFLLRLSWLSSGISRFDTIDFLWSAFSSTNYLIAALVLSSYMKCMGFLHYDCGCRLASNFFGYVVAILYGYDTYLFSRSAAREDTHNGVSVAADS